MIGESDGSGMVLEAVVVTKRVQYAFGRGEEAIEESFPEIYACSTCPAAAGWRA